MSWRASRTKRLEAKAIAALGYRLVALLGRTLRWKTEGLEHFDRLDASGRRPVMAFWHGRILPATYFFRRRGIVVITSENFDGEWIAGIIERFGYGTARGSTSRGARKALLQLTRDMAEGKPAGFTVDGPRGPARIAQPGAVWLAKATGNPVVPFHLEADRHWTLNSWDRTQIPKPFSTVALVVGEPFHVRADADDEAIEFARQELDRRLHALEGRASELLERASTRMKTILETERLKLRELVHGDLDFMAEMLADSDVMHYPKRLTRQLSADWIARQMARYKTDGYGLWLAEQRDSGTPIGQVGLVRRTVNGVDETEVGYLIHRPFWRHGFATEGARACRDYAFHTLRKPRLIALVMPDNVASQGVAKSLDMEVVGRTPHNGHEHLVFAVANPAEARTLMPEARSPKP